MGCQVQALRAVQNTLQRYGISVSQQDIKSKNVAAVMIMPAAQ